MSTIEESLRSVEKSIGIGVLYIRDTSEGMAWIFEDTPASRPIAFTTAVFAKHFCEQDGYYIWREA